MTLCGRIGVTVERLRRSLRKVYPQWRQKCKDIEDTRTMGCSLRTVEDVESSQPDPTQTNYMLELEGPEK